MKLEFPKGMKQTTKNLIIKSFGTHNFNNLNKDTYKTSFSLQDIKNVYKCNDCDIHFYEWHKESLNYFYDYGETQHQPYYFYTQYTYKEGYTYCETEGYTYINCNEVLLKNILY